MNKNLICSRFCKCLASYDENAVVQKEMATKLMQKLESSCFENVLEIGCGTGFLTKLAKNNLKYTSYTAVDIVADCEQYIHNIDSNIKFVASDIEEFIEEDSQKYDLILSNASLQWIKNFSSFSGKLIEKLSKNGIFLFSAFGKNNFQEITTIFNKSLEYIQPNEYKQIFKNYITFIDEELIQLKFETAKDILKHMHYTGVNAIEQTKWTKSDMFKFESEYYNLCKGAPTLTYNPIYIKINK